MGQRWECPGEGDGEVELVWRLVVLGKSEHGVFEAEEDPRIDVKGEVQVQWTAAAVLGMQVDLPDLAERVGLDEVPLVMHVEAMVDRVVLQVRDVPSHVDGSHDPTLPGGGKSGRRYARHVTDEELLQLLEHAAVAVKDAVGGLQRQGLSGLRATQYVADLVADEAALSVLLDAGLRVVSEESGQSGEGPLVCVLDPIDGSTNFDRGIPFYSTSMCVLDDEGMRCSVVVNLATDTWYEAVRGKGATRNGAPIEASRIEAISKAIVSCAGTPTMHPGWAQFRALGSASLELCAVADGSLDGFVLVGTARLNPWDYLGGLLVAEEAGALVRDPDGGSLVVATSAPRRLVAAATPQLFEELLAFAAVG